MVGVSGGVNCGKGIAMALERSQSWAGGYDR